MNDLEKLNSVAGDVSGQDVADGNAFAALENRLKKVEQERKEDQFFFVFTIILIIDAILFMFLIDGLAALTLGLMQFILLLVLADRCDVKYFEVIFRRVTGIFKNGEDG